MQLDKNNENKYIKIRIKKLKSFSDISYLLLQKYRDHMLWSNYGLQHVVPIVKCLFYCK